MDLPRVLSQIINISLDAQAKGEGPHTKSSQVAAQLLGKEDSLLHRPVRQGLLSKTISLMPKKITKQWFDYKEAETGLEDLFKSLQNTHAITVTVDDLAGYHKFCICRKRGGKEVVGESLRLAVEQLHLPQKKKLKLHKIVDAIQERLNNVTAFYEEFPQLNKLSSDITAELVKLEETPVELAKIRKNLEAIQREGNKISMFGEFPVGRELAQAFTLLEKKELEAYEAQEAAKAEQEFEEAIRSHGEFGYLFGEELADFSLTDALHNSAAFGLALNALGYLPKYGQFFSQYARTNVKAEPTTWQTVGSHAAGVTLLASYLIYYSDVSLSVPGLMVAMLPFAAARLLSDASPVYKDKIHGGSPGVISKAIVPANACRYLGKVAAATATGFFYLLRDSETK